MAEMTDSSAGAATSTCCPPEQQADCFYGEGEHQHG